MNLIKINSFIILALTGLFVSCDNDPSFTETKIELSEEFIQGSWFLDDLSVSNGSLAVTVNDGTNPEFNDEATYVINDNNPPNYNISFGNGSEDNAFVENDMFTLRYAFDRFTLLTYDGNRIDPKRLNSPNQMGTTLVDGVELTNLENIQDITSRFNSDEGNLNEVFTSLFTRNATVVNWEILPGNQINLKYTSQIINDTTGVTESVNAELLVDVFIINDLRMVLSYQTNEFTPNFGGKVFDQNFEKGESTANQFVAPFFIPELEITPVVNNFGATIDLIFNRGSVN